MSDETKPVDPVKARKQRQRNAVPSIPRSSDTPVEESNIPAAEPPRANADIKVPSRPAADNEILIHFIDDGMTALGQVWLRGQELRVEIGSREYNMTVTNGKSWMLMTEDEQIDRYEKVLFRQGPWRGKGWTDPEAAALEEQRAGKAELPGMPSVAEVAQRLEEIRKR